MVQWLKPHAFTVGGINSIPGLDPRSHLKLGMVEKKKKSVWMQMGRRERRGEKKGAVTPTSNQELLVAATGSSLMTKALGWIHLLAVCLEDALEPCVL